MIIKRIGMTQLQSDALCLRLVREIHETQNAPHGQLYHHAQSAAACARQAVAFRQSEQGLELTVIPLFRYYSLLNTLKSLLYIFDLEFPASTAVLQHGLSVRRMKRNSYQWLWEFVSLHKDGIAQAFKDIRDREVELPSRFIMGELLGQFPQMFASVHIFDKHFVHAYPLQGGPENTCYVSRDIASNQGMTISEWTAGYHAPSGMNSTACEPTGPPGLMRVEAPSADHPWYGQYEGMAYLQDSHRYPLWLVHYGLLYSLSALCRYSPSEWSDIVLWQSEPDALLVREYFKIPPLQLYLQETDGWDPNSSICYGEH